MHRQRRSGAGQQDAGLLLAHSRGLIERTAGTSALAAVIIRPAISHLPHRGRQRARAVIDELLVGSAWASAAGSFIAQRPRRQIQFEHFCPDDMGVIADQGFHPPQIIGRKNRVVAKQLERILRNCGKIHVAHPWVECCLNNHISTQGQAIFLPIKLA